MPEQLSLEHLSKLWWGNSLRLRAAGWIRARPAGERFYQRQIARELATEAGYVRRELELLAAIGAISPLPQEPGERRQLYINDPDHPLWAIVDAAHACIEQLQTPEQVAS